jgi:hypothetical protein
LCPIYTCYHSHLIMMELALHLLHVELLQSCRSINLSHRHHNPSPAACSTTQNASFKACQLFNPLPNRQSLTMCSMQYQALHTQQTLPASAVCQLPSSMLLLTPVCWTHTVLFRHLFQCPDCLHLLLINMGAIIQLQALYTKRMHFSIWLWSASISSIVATPGS